MSITLTALKAIPLIQEGDDLAKIIENSLNEFKSCTRR